MVLKQENDFSMKEEKYSGSRTTVQLVGLKDVVEAISVAAFHETDSTIIYITGVGGVGKTRLLQHVLRMMTGDQQQIYELDNAIAENTIVANELIDLYHTRNRNVVGLVEALFASVPELDYWVRSTNATSNIDYGINELLRNIERAEHAGLSYTELLGRQKDLAEQLILKINQFTEKRRLIFAVDTAERFFIARDTSQDKLGLFDQLPPVLHWLLNDFLPQLQNVVLLLAGRPEPLNLTHDLQQLTEKSGQKFLCLKLHGLREEESLQYFAAIVSQASEGTGDENQHAAAILSKLDENKQRTIFHCLHDGSEVPYVKPILLALAIDHLVASGRPLPAFGLPLSVAYALSIEERRQIETELSNSIVQALREYRRPADEIILLLGWLQKGATIELLAFLSELPIDEVYDTVAQIVDLSFVKVRPTDNRIFLHDEMYELLQKYALVGTSPSEVNHIFTLVQTYYTELIAQRRHQIDDLYMPLAATFTETVPEPWTIRAARAELQDAITEELFYRLRLNPKQAFQHYYLYLEGAFANNDYVLITSLRAEMFSYLAESESRKVSHGTDEISVADVTADSAVRWVQWMWSQEQYENAYRLANHLASDADYLVAPGGYLAKAHLTVWFGYVSIYVSRYEYAETLLTQTIAQLHHWGQINTRTFRWAAILARAYSSLGYLYDRLWRSHEAIEAYKRALPLWRSVKLQVEEAAALSNGAFACARIGAFTTGLVDARAGLRLREQLGPGVPVGISVSTLAEIELLSNDLMAARRDAERAYEIFADIQSARGCGLALTTLAEAMRRLSQLTTYLKQGISADILEIAVDKIEQAIQIFTNEIAEPVRLIEAIRTKGCIYRTWFRLRYLRPRLTSKQENVDGIHSSKELFTLSAKAFQDALSLANREEVLLRLEILLDLAFLYYYAALPTLHEKNSATPMEIDDALLQGIKQLLPDEYQQLNTESKDVPRSWYWVQSAVFEVLKGHIAYYSYPAQKHDASTLTIVLQHYLRGLTFHSYFSEHIFQQRRIAYDQVYENLSSLGSTERRIMYQVVEKLEIDSGFTAGESELSRFIKERFGDEIELLLST